MKILCIGDSLTYGYRVDEEKRWTYLASAELCTEFINKGALGDSTAGMIMRFYPEVISTKPDAAFIMGGSNDFLMNRSLEGVENNVKQIIKEAKQLNIKVVLGIQPPMIPHLAEKLWASNINYEEINKKISCYGDWVKNYSTEYDFLYIDFFNEFITSIPPNYLERYYLDGLHLSDAGHEIMYKCAVKAFMKFNML